MTQDRRITDKLPAQPLEWDTEGPMISSALIHLESEGAAACLVRAKDDLWVGAGTKDALRGLLREDASQSQAVPSELASLDRFQPHARLINAMQRSEQGNYVRFADVQSLFSHSAATGKVPASVLDLPGAIMNLPCKRARDDFASLMEFMTYKEGCRDARHAAADLVLERADELAALASPAAPLAAAVPAEEATTTLVTLNRAQVEELLEATEDDDKESNTEITIIRHHQSFTSTDGDPMEAGLYFYWTDYPEEGVVPLAGTVSNPAPAEPAPIQQHQCATCKDTGIVYTGPLGDPPEQCDACFDQEPAPIQASAEMLIEVADLLSERNWRGDLQEELRDLAARLSKPTAPVAADAAVTAESIDTPEFRELMGAHRKVYTAALKAFDPMDDDQRADNEVAAAWHALIAHIDRHIAAQAPADRDAQQWISVDERLPERGQQVIVYRPTALLTHDEPVRLVRYTGSERESWQNVKHGFDCICHPTHWMPLPSQPAASHGAVEGEQNEGGEHA